jgi:hypothetical protein
VKPQLRAAVLRDELSRHKALYAQHGGERTNLTYGYVRKRG